MKKVVLVTQAKDARDTVGALRKAGLLHIEHIQEPKGQDILRISDSILLLDQAIGVLVSAFPQAKQDTLSGEQIDWERIATHIIDIKKRQEQIKEYGVTLQGEIRKWEPWGDFDPEDILLLRQHNVFLGFYQIPLEEIKILKARFLVREISRNDDTLNCLVITRGQADIPYKELDLPKSSLSTMQRRLEEDAKVTDSLNAEIAKYITYYQELIYAKSRLEKELEFYQALSGMGEDGALSYIKGFVPTDAQRDLATVAKREKWALHISDPAPEDNVPTLLRNSRLVSLISPLFKFLEILPGYSELDISLPFLIFFSLFFGILIGDAGYGLIYMLLTFCCQRRLRKKNIGPAVFYLFYILSSCAITIGVLTGTFFGQEWLVRLGVRPLVPALNDPHNIQAICFFIGALHLSIAHGWRFILKMPSLAALADLGWIFILWTAFFLAKALVLGDSFPSFARWLVIAGIASVLLFTSPQRNILKGVLQGLGTLALSLMNNFTDVVSYVRLFAVGLAGIAIADAFNSMAALFGSGGILATLVGVLILIIGHSLGVILGSISVLVHGVRLNVLEFSGHANVTWSGFSYNPLKE